LVEKELPTALRKVSEVELLLEGGVPVQLRGSLQRAGVSTEPIPVQVAWAKTCDWPTMAAETAKRARWDGFMNFEMGFLRFLGTRV
jgi:hypothetical protein